MKALIMVILLDTVILDNQFSEIQDKNGRLPGGPDSLPIATAEPQEAHIARANSSCACGTPIASYRGRPAIAAARRMAVEEGLEEILI
jgi:hypothetical protein